MGGRAVISINESKAGLGAVIAVLQLDQWGFWGAKRKRPRFVLARPLRKTWLKLLVLFQLLSPDTAAPFAVASATAADGAERGRFANHAAAIQRFVLISQEHDASIASSARSICSAA
jgi:hypothetical protein